MAQSPGTTRRTFPTRTAAGALGAAALAAAGAGAAGATSDSPTARPLVLCQGTSAPADRGGGWVRGTPGTCA